MPMVAMPTRKAAPIWSRPGSITSSGWTNTATISVNSEMQICSARLSTRVERGVGDLGGDGGDQRGRRRQLAEARARKNAKKCTTHGLTPAWIIGGAITIATRM